MRLQGKRDRVGLIEHLDKVFAREVDRLQDKFYEYVREFYERELSTDGKHVKKTTRNYAKLHGIEGLAREFADKEAAEVIKKMALAFSSLVTVNEDYFGGVAHVRNKLKQDIRNELLTRYGIATSGRQLKIIKGGWLHGLSRVEDPFRRVQEVGIKAVAQGVPLEQLRREIKQATYSPGVRTVKHHFRTNANDAYAQFDRTTQVAYADNLGLRAFIYEGGLIDTSRPFCEERNGQVFTIEEAQQWINMDWKGKNKDYDPLRDMGGHNCRHHPSFISAALAIRLRPDLEDYFKNAA